MSATMKPTKTIWVLFSVDNNYDQPDHNLVAWWIRKPTLLGLARAINKTASKTATKTEVRRAWNGDEVRVGFESAATDFRLQKIGSGLVKEER